jgi:hypothetical protein
MTGYVDVQETGPRNCRGVRTGYAGTVVIFSPVLGRTQPHIQRISWVDLPRLQANHSSPSIDPYIHSPVCLNGKNNVYFIPSSTVEGNQEILLSELLSLQIRTRHFLNKALHEATCSVAIQYSIHPCGPFSLLICVLDSRTVYIPVSNFPV